MYLLKSGWLVCGVDWPGMSGQYLLKGGCLMGWLQRYIIIREAASVR
jgi:hypothetical protein